MTDIIKGNEAEIKKLRQEIFDVVKEKWLKKTYPLLKAQEGTYWKVRNYRSCPETAKDYWWLCLRVDRVELDEEKGMATAYCSEIQINADNKLTIESRIYTSHASYPSKSFLYDGCKKCTKQLWNTLIKRAKTIITDFE